MPEGISGMVIWFGLFFVIIYFIIIRPNKKQQKKRMSMLDSLKAKTEIITIGGIHGTISRVKEDTVIIKVANNVEIELLKTGIQSIQDDDDDDFDEIETKKDKKKNKQKAIDKEKAEDAEFEEVVESDDDI
ncbi:MAG: preprotein translocase subunit YajC [Eubacteriales bacterium]